MLLRTLELDGPGEEEDRRGVTANRPVADATTFCITWQGERESSTIPGVAKRLRDRLITEDMLDLAAAIDGSVCGYYGLILV